MRWALLFTLALRSCDTQANKVPPGTFIAKSLIDGSEWVRRPHLSEKDSKCVTVLSSEGRKSVIMCFVFTVFFTLISSRCFTRARFFKGSVQMPMLWANRQIQTMEQFNCLVIYNFWTKYPVHSRRIQRKYFAVKRFISRRTSWMAGLNTEMFVMEGWGLKCDNREFQGLKQFVVVDANS